MLRVAVAISLAFNLFVCTSADNGSSDDIRSLLELAVLDIQQSRPIDVVLLGRVVDLQLQIGDEENARLNFQLLATGYKDNQQKNDGPSSEFLQEIAHSHELDKFLSRVGFFEKALVEVGSVANWTKQIDSMKVTMISRAAREKRFDLAENLLRAFSTPPSLVDGITHDVQTDHPVVLAAKTLCFEYVRDERIDDAIRVAGSFPDFSIRQFLGSQMYRWLKFDDSVESDVDKLMHGASSEIESHWVRCKFDGAIKRKEADKAISLLGRLEELQVDRTAFYKSKIAKLLQMQGDSSRARQFLNETTSKVADIADVKRDLPVRKLAKQLGEAGEIDKVIEMCRDWKRDDVRSSYKRIQTRHVQPLYQIAIDFASKGRIEEAVSIAQEIRDDFWRADTINDIAKKQKSPTLTAWKQLSDHALSIATTINPVSERDIVLSRVIAARLNEQRLNFDEVVAETELIESKKRKAICIGKGMESRIRSGASPAQIRQAADIVLAGDTDSLASIMDGLQITRQLELASELALKIDPNLDSEYFPFGVYKSISEKWSWERQEEFILNAVESRRANLFMIALDSASEANVSKIRHSALSFYSDKMIDVDMFCKLLGGFIEEQEFDSLKILTKTSIQFDGQNDEEYLSTQLEKVCLKQAKSLGTSGLDSIESAVSTEWAQEAVMRSRVKHDIMNGKQLSALERIDKIPEPLIRARFRIVAADTMIQKL